jgi:uncharacterized protein YqhQ/methylase of polypeptide subunit release factors
MKNKKEKEERVKKTLIGGQALLEGVMMRGKTAMAMAVMNEDGVLLLETERIKKKNKIARIPIVRGLLSFVMSMVLGIKTLARSAEVISSNEEEKLSSGAMALSVIISIVFALGLFFFIPGFLADLFRDYVVSNVLLRNLIAGIIRIAIFIGYLAVISLMKDIRRTFMYHGAEHKTINCFEKGLPLTVENVRSCSKKHARCGTTFMFLVMIISIIIFSFADWGLNELIGPDKIISMEKGFLKNLLFMGIKLLLLPFVAGISYEVLMGFAALPENLFVRIVRSPGLALQKLTTKEPDEKMIAVAIKSFSAVYEMDNDQSIKERKFEEIPLSQLRQQLDEIMQEIGAEEAETDWILCEVIGCKRGELAFQKNISPSNYHRAMLIANKRREQPLDYCLGKSNFFGREIKVDQRVLLPRMETEILVEKAIEIIKEKQKKNSQAVQNKISEVENSANEKEFLKKQTENETAAIETAIKSTETENTAAKIESDSLETEIKVSKETKPTSFAKNQSRVEVLDLCTGSGCIALTLAKETDANITASDISKEALAVARENLYGSSVEIIESDLFDSIKTNAFDLIVSNPPYIAYSDMQSLQKEVLAEPHIALFGGENGLEIIEKIINQAAKHLKNKGILLLEVGYNQAEDVCKMALCAGFERCEIIKDLCGVDRIVKLQC